VSELDDLVALELAPNRRCKVCRWYEKQDPAIQESFDKYIAEGVEGTKLARACQQLKTDPLDCGASTVLRHMRECLH
jgi:hypothetical protein